MPGAAHADRPRGLSIPVAVAVYSFVVLANVNLAAFFALAPTFREDLGLSGAERDVLFTGTGIVMLALAMPMGTWADRLGVRRVTLVTAGLLVVSALGHAVAVDLWSLLAARIVFAAAFTGMLTAAMAWLAGATPPERQARAIGGIMPCAGSGLLVGPYLAGALTDASGTRLAYAVLCVLSLAPLVLGLLAPVGAPIDVAPTPLGVTLAALRAPIVAAAVVLALLGIVLDTSLNLLVPQQLDDNGLSAGARGAVLSIGAGVFVATALVAVRRAERLTTLRAAGMVAMLGALAVVPALLSDSTAAQATTMVVRGLVLSFLFVIAYPLGTLGAFVEGIPLGASAGLLMLATGVGNTGAPLAAGRGADALGGTALYAILAGVAAVTGLWMLWLSGRTATRRTTR